MAGAAALLLLFLAQSTAGGAAEEPSAAAGAHAAASETLKERLSDKASDEQRVDNCRVPKPLRGTKLRPDCDDRGAAATGGPDRRSSR